MSDISIYADGINKKFKEATALQDISFNIYKNELFGFIGPDGAGKTTLFRILATLLLADKGSASVESNDVVKDYKAIRKITGYMPGRFSLYQDLTVEENLKFYATIFGTTIKENYHLIEKIYSHIEPFRNRKAKDLSGGMKQKLALSCALIHKPKVLILDEPTTGVDAVSRKEFWEMLKHLQNTDITILVSTPYMDEASLCDRVALFQTGKILTIDSPQNIINNFQSKLLAIRSENTYKLISDLNSYENVKSVIPFGQFVHITSATEHIDIEKIDHFLTDRGHKNIEIKQIEANIEDCFMELMN